jgi:hypothetical protein
MSFNDMHINCETRNNEPIELHVPPAVTALTKVANQSWRNNQSEQCVSRLLSNLISFSVCNMHSRAHTSFINIAVQPCLSTHHQHHQQHLSASLYMIIFNLCMLHLPSPKYRLPMKAIRFYITRIINPLIIKPEGSPFVCELPTSLCTSDSM